MKKNICYFDNNFNGTEDYELWLRLKYFNNSKFYNVDKILVKHILDDDSTFNKNNDSQIEYLKKKYMEILSFGKN